MKNMILMKKIGKKRLTQARRQKPFEDLRQKTKKKDLDWIGRAKRGKELLKIFEKSEEYVREKSF